MSISKEAWYKIAGERDLAHLLKAHQKANTLETATDLWRASLRAGKLPPLKYEWLEALKAEGEEIPSYNTLKSTERTLVNTVTGELSHEERSAEFAERLDLFEIVDTFREFGGLGSLMAGPEALEIDGSLYLSISFYAVVEEINGYYFDVQEDERLKIDTSLGNVEQIALWVQE